MLFRSALAEFHVDRAYLTSSAVSNGTNCWAQTDPVPFPSGVELVDAEVYNCITNGAADTVVTFYRVAAGGATTSIVASVTAVSGGITSVLFNTSAAFGDRIRAEGDQTNSAFKAAVLWQQN